MKKAYIAPQVELIPLDNEITLALASEPAPPAGPGEVGFNAPAHFNNNPYKSQA